MRILENQFSWSSSRAGAFRRCLRAYWWQYYGSWGGWDPQAPAETREAYTLKNLSYRWAWVGTVVHHVVEHILKRLQRQATSGHFEFGATDIDPTWEVEETTRLMRRHYRESRSGAYRNKPKKKFGLAEHEYRDPVPDEEWRACNDKARAAVRGFLESDVFARIRATDPSTWFPIETLDQFDLDGVGVWAVPDFAYRLPDGGAEIYDWKTGAVSEDANRLQLACYTLYVATNHGVDPLRVKNHVVYLGPEVVVHDFVLTAEEIEEARTAIRASMDEMRARLADPAANRAEREDFPLTDDLSKCEVCVYRRLCGR
ncbi:MAG: PD-(D/E)XK nuclease family protein [Planctomycetota bacterium]